MVKPLWILAMTLAGAGLAGADSVPDAKGTASAALKAYAAMDYAQAGKLARTIPHTPEGRLVSGLCDVYDRTRQDIRRGQLTLAELFYNDKTPLPYRLEAGVALGRTTQLMKERRDLYRDAADRYDHVKIFEAVRKLAPGSSADRNAFFYLHIGRIGRYTIIQHIFHLGCIQSSQQAIGQMQLQQCFIGYQQYLIIALGLNQRWQFFYFAGAFQ